MQSLAPILLLHILENTLTVLNDMKNNVDILQQIVISYRPDLLHTGMDSEPACRARKAGTKSREFLVMLVEVVDPLGGFWRCFIRKLLLYIID